MGIAPSISKYDTSTTLKRWYPPESDAQTTGWSEVQPVELSNSEMPWHPSSEAGETKEVPLVDETLSPKQLRQAQDLLQTYVPIFSSQPGKVEDVEHIISTPPGHVVQTTNRPIPWKNRATINKEVEDMLRMGVIEPSTSTWRNSIVLVPKPDGSVHFCIDFQAVNKVAEFDAYPMPRTDILLSRLGETR